MKNEKIIIDEVKNSGLIMEEPDERDYILGGFGDDFRIINAGASVKKPPIIFKNSKGWNKVAIDYGLPEKQFNRLFDSFSCVIYAIAKQMCYYLFKRYGIRITVAEMYNAFYAKVKPGVGTTIRNGMESFRKKGWVADKEYPFTSDMTSSDFFKKPPKRIQIIANGKKTEWDFNWGILSPYLDNIKEQYKRTPVVLTGYAWGSKNGIYYNDNMRFNHAFVGLEVLNNRNNLCDDTYPRCNKYSNNFTKDDMLKELDKTYRYGSAHACWLTPTEKTKKTLLTYILNMFKKISRDVHGGFWFIKDGKKQKITDWMSMLGSIIDEVGVEKNNLTDNELSSIPDYKFFGR